MDQKGGYHVKFGALLGVPETEFGRSGVKLVKFTARNYSKMVFSIVNGVLGRVIDVR